MDFLHQALSALPDAAKSPLALIAYVVAIIGSIAYGVLVVRNRNLLQRIESFPERDRLKALEAELGHVRITGGMSADQYLRHKRNQYLLMAFVVLCLAIVLFVVAVRQGSQQTPNADSVHGFRPIDVSLRCFHDDLPITVPVGNTARVMGLNESFSKATRDVVFYEIPNSRSTPLLWPDLLQVQAAEQQYDNSEAFVWRCEARNNSDSSVVNLIVPLKITYVSGHDRQYPALVKVETIPRSGLFTFYVVNGCPVQAMFMLPSKGTGKFIGEQSIREIEFTSRADQNFSLDANHSNWLQRTCETVTESKNDKQTPRRPLSEKAYGPSQYPLNASAAKVTEMHQRYMAEFFGKSNLELRQFAANAVADMNTFEMGWQPSETERPPLDAVEDPKTHRDTPESLKRINDELELRRLQDKRRDKDYAEQFEAKFPFVNELATEMERRCSHRNISVNDLIRPAAVQRLNNGASEFSGYLFKLAERCLPD
jgi:hypothetical protein